MNFFVNFPLYVGGFQTPCRSTNEDGSVFSRSKFSEPPFGKTLFARGHYFKRGGTHFFRALKETGPAHSFFLGHTAGLFFHRGLLERGQGSAWNNFRLKNSPPFAGDISPLGDHAGVPPPLFFSPARLPSFHGGDHTLGGPALAPNFFPFFWG